jgi:hypothetical protein
MLAILASGAAVAIEALVVTAAFVRSERYRLTMGAGALSLLAGFRLFMGVFWPGWWILLLGFLPWQRLSERMRSHRARETREVPLPAHLSAIGAATAAQLALVAFVIVQQVVVSALALERAPMFSHYPMYSDTYASPEAFTAAQRPWYRIVVSTDTGDVELSCDASGELLEDFRDALGGSAEAEATLLRAVIACRPDLAAARRVSIQQERRAFDWDRRAFVTEPRVILGTVAMHTPADGARND